jgi:hypothetical protein
MPDRIEREIEEILRKIDDFVPDTSRGRRPQRRPARPAPTPNPPGWFSRRLAAISLTQVMWWSLFVVIVSFFARAVPGAEWVMIGALIVFATAFFLSLGRGGRRAAGQEKVWRGQPLDLSGPGWPDRIKAWVKGRKRN